MAENAETIATFDRELREVIQRGIEAELSRQAIAGTIMAASADFNQSKPLLAAYGKPAEPH